MTPLVIFDRIFEKQAERLPLRLKAKLARQVEILSIDPYDSRLHIKKLSEPFSGIFTFRVTRDWRVSFCFYDANTIHVLEVKHRKDIYR